MPEPGTRSVRLGQFRLSRLQVVNWGTFPGYRDLPVDERGVLFTGPSGSGKSQLLDAHSVALLPFRDQRFNASADLTARGSKQAARTIVPITYMRTKLALAGKSKAEIKEGMKAAVEKKELPALESGAMCYMMSKQAYLTDKGITQDGAHNMAHVMFYTTQINPADWGANLDNSPIVIDPRGKNDPEPINTFMMLTGAWSDGSPAPLS